ncbi:MAG TPA: T9SS type A sorting domain-containing protein, partial [Candidatus Kapabacteria bacterium]|nr:T9SS type A sorting domain-containing protein [Candidatus Kapabacteria bacterium]
YRSTDGGVNWDSVSSGLLFTGYNCVAMNNGKVFLGTAGTNGTGSNGGVYTSTDNGAHWDTTMNGIPAQADYVNCFAFSSGYAFAGMGFNGVYRSSDNGATWQAADNGLPGTADAISCMAASGNTVYVGLNESTGYGIYISTDNGSSWTPVNYSSFMLVPGISPQSIAANGANVFVEMLGGGIYRSTDNGAHWDSVENGLAFPGSLNCLATGSGDNVFAATYGAAYLTMNNGGVWDTVTGDLANSNVFTLAVGGGYVFAGTSNGVWRRPLSDFGINAVNEKSNDLPAQFSLSQNYPNPFSGATNVEFRIPNEEYVTLNVYNALGEQVATLAQGMMSAGTHSVQLSAEGLQNGLYFYRLTAGKSVQTGKMTVIH